MRNLVITENITLDGVVDASKGWFAPFEEMRGFWPLQTSCLRATARTTDASQR